MGWIFLQARWAERNVNGSSATTPEPPYYAVIFTSVRHDGDNEYGEAAKQMLELASKQPGFWGLKLQGKKLEFLSLTGPRKRQYKLGKKT